MGSISAVKFAALGTGQSFGAASLISNSTTYLHKIIMIILLPAMPGYVVLWSVVRHWLNGENACTK